MRGSQLDTGAPDATKFCAMAKKFVTEAGSKVVDQCLQLHGGYGFMEEYPISRDYCDSAVQSIYAGTNEIMKVIVARRLGLDE